MSWLEVTVQMRNTALVFMAVVFLCTFTGFSQYEKPGDKNVQKPEEAVQEWFKRINALNGTEESVNRLLEMYQADALQQTGPSEKQLGQVIYQNRRQIQKWIVDFSKTHVAIPDVAFFSIRVQTINEKTAELLSTGQTPWGDSIASAEFTARYMDPESKKGYMLFGAAFFQFRDGKISRLRLYMPREEIMQIEPPFKT